MLTVLMPVPGNVISQCDQLSRVMGQMRCAS